MKRRHLLKSTAAVSGGTVTEINKAAAKGGANRIPAGKLWRIRTGLAALTVCFVLSVGQAAPGAPPSGGLLAEIQLLDKHLRVGHPVRLRALHLPDTQTHVSWQFEGQPLGSKAKFDNHTSPDASFVPNVPGIFIVRLTVRRRNETRTGTLGVTVTNAPIVPVNTIAADAQGNPGMMIGDDFFLYDTSNGPGFQVVQVDRNTLAVYHNNTVPFDANAISQYTTFFSQTPDSVLIFVALPASAGPVPANLIDAVNTWLSTIGGFLPPEWNFRPISDPCWSSNTPVCHGDYAGQPVQWFDNGYSYLGPGSFSVIGVPGMAPGSAWYDDATQRGTTNGPLVGYLTPGTGVGGVANADAYTFVFPQDQYVLVDSCASGGPGACVIKVGSQTFAPDAGVNGVHVLVLDRVTLQPLTHQTVTSTQTLFSALSTPPPIPQVGHQMFLPYGSIAGTFTDRVLVVMQSVGTGALTYDAATPVLQVIDELGGTPETFGPAITEGKPYSLIGVMSNLPWHGTGIESSPAIILGQSPNIVTPFPGHARGALARDRFARYTPTANDPVGNANLDLLPIIYQDPTPWPYAGSCSITYIANVLGLATLNTDGSESGNPDIRSGYPNLSIPWDTMNALSAPYPNVFPSYCPQSSFLSPGDYASLQQRLQSEFKWVTAVLGNPGLIANLQAPFTQTQGSTQTTVFTVASEVYNSLQPPAQANTSFSWATLINLSFATASVFAPNESSALGLISDAGQFAVDSMTSSSSGDPATVVFAQALQLATQLNDQTLAHINQLGNMGTILVSDAGKLETVGSNLLSSSIGGPWAWDSTTAKDAVNALNATTSQTTYSALLPPSWPVFNLKPDLVHQFSSNNVSTFGCGYAGVVPGGVAEGINQPFGLALSANQFQALIQLVAGQKPSETATTEVWAFGKMDPNFTTTGKRATVPSTSLTDSLFSITTADAAGAYPPAWWRSTYNPPSVVVCDNLFASTDSYQLPPPVIPPPAAAYGQQ